MAVIIDTVTVSLGGERLRAFVAIGHSVPNLAIQNQGARYANKQKCPNVSVVHIEIVKKTSPAQCIPIKKFLASNPGSWWS